MSVLRRFPALGWFVVALLAACGGQDEVSIADAEGSAADEQVESVEQSTTTALPASTTTSATSTSTIVSTTTASSAVVSTTESVVETTTIATTTVAPTTTTSVVPTTTTAAPTTTTTTTAAPAGNYQARILEIDASIAARMGASWREGCPVALADLRLIELTHWNYAGNESTGELVVAASEATGIVEVFRKLHAAGFPIERMELVDVYGGDDDASMAANNTSGFNCREVAWRPGVWSNHAFGKAIDINPLVNPYVGRGEVLPPGGAPFVDRSTAYQGAIYAGDVVVQAFEAIGWSWGGYWSSSKDYQHFDNN